LPLLAEELDAALVAATALPLDAGIGLTLVPELPALARVAGRGPVAVVFLAAMVG